MRRENMIWHGSFLLYAWIVKEKWGFGEKGDTKVGGNDKDGYGKENKEY